MGKAEASWEETSTCTMRTAGIRGQTSAERFAEITLGKASFQPGLTATGEDGDSERTQRDSEERGLTPEPVRARRVRSCWPQERSTLRLTRSPLGGAKGLSVIAGTGRVPLQDTGPEE